ncbi:hypothetical protein [Archaeoglobus profundus]|uniref:Uncharacterized protein n=1 Tax=Archaeoglobus profundus (strain DSM 5631 / JCM 9629 / NBRC 100127 / Av18) TaxID=572546 RepID=D2RDU7_ARCPA|nr:hypothetical protein [Archaeoglobus profundus]ADB58291.1 hypothetical protein Arcpr_1239 [Archaeoglobus profundus DSM 5631]
MEQKQIVYIGPVMLDEPEMFSLDEFVRQAIALEAERLFYSNGRLFLIDYETLHGIIDGKFAIVELITYASFCEVGDFRNWVLYYGNDDVVEYVDRIKDIRGDMTIIPVLRTNDRFIRKVEEYINAGKYKSFIINE